MLTKLNLTKRLVLAGTVAVATAVVPLAAGDAFTAGATTSLKAPTHVAFKDDHGRRNDILEGADTRCLQG
jgi:hypothetical protein